MFDFSSGYLHSSFACRVAETSVRSSTQGCDIACQRPRQQMPKKTHCNWGSSCTWLEWRSDWKCLRPILLLAAHLVLVAEEIPGQLLLHQLVGVFLAFLHLLRVLQESGHRQRRKGVASKWYDSDGKDYRSARSRRVFVLVLFWY